MAKKKIISASKDLELDYDLDMDDFNFDEPEVKDDRTPVVKIATNIPKGALEGIQDTTFLKNVLKNVLPDGFGQTIDLTDKISDNVKSVYDKAAKEIKPAVKEFKRVAPKLVSQDNKYVPKNVKDLLKRWQEEQTSTSIQSIEEQRESMLFTQMADIFKQQTEQDVHDRANAEAKDRLQQGIELSRHKDIFSLNNDQAQSLSKIEQYHYNIDLRFKKKALELQYRQLFALQDTLKHLKADAVNKEANLLSIAKNTSLPEYVKLQNTEVLGDVFRTKFAESLNAGLFSARNDLIQKTFDNLGTKITDKLKDYSDNFITGMSAIEEAKYDIESMSSMPGFDKNQMIGEQLGSGLAQGAGIYFTSKDDTTISYKVRSVLKGKDLLYFEDQLKRNPNQIGTQVFPELAKKNKKLFFDKNGKPLTLSQIARMGSDEKPGMGVRAGNKVRDLLLNNPLSKKFNLQEKGVKLENFNSTLDGQINEFKNKDFGWDEGFKYRAFEFLQELIPGSDVDKKLDHVGLNDINKPYSFTRKTDKTITEIIPGFLARIYREMQVIRTGNESIELTKFDYDSGRFTSSDKLAKRLLDKIVDKRDVSYSKTNLKEMSTEMLGDSDVSQSSKDKLHKSLLTNSANKRLATTQNLLSGMDENTRRELEPVLGKFFSSMTEEDKLRFNKKYNNLKDVIPDNREFIQRAKDAGYFEELKKTGIVKSNKEIDLDKLMSFYHEEQKNKQPKNKNINKNSNLDINSLEPNIQNTSNFFSSLKQNTNQILSSVKQKINNNPEFTNIFKDLKTKAVEQGNNLSKIYLIEKEKIKTLLGDKSEEFNSLMEDYNSLDSNGKKIFFNLLYQNIKNNIKQQYVNLKEKTNLTVSNLYESLNKDNRIEIAKEQIKDIYVGSEIEPRLTAAAMQAGEYIDKVTGETISSIEDIKGDIIDKHGNTVLKSFERMKLFYYDSKSKIMKKINTTYIDLKPKIKDYSNKTSMFLNRAISNIQETYLSAIDTVKDVYVKGEKEPRLTAAKIKAGLYRDKETGNVITDARYLEGDVVDENNNTVISKDEIEKLVAYEPAFKTFMPIRQLGKALKYVGNKLWYYQTVIAPAWTKWNFKQLGKALNFTKDVGLALVRGRVKDVYVGDEKEPRLYAARIKNGEYFLKSNGKVITHQNHITDAIVDQYGNTVIAYDELENLRVYESIFQWINPFKLGAMAIKGLTKATTYLAKKTFKFGVDLAKANLRALGSLTKIGIRYLTKPVDVYISDKKDPVIYAKDLKEGKYYSKKTGKQLFHHTDIDGEIVDENGTTILTEDEALSGLYDISGKKLKSNIFTGIGKAFKKLDKLFSYRSKFNPVKSLPKNESDASKQGMSRSDFISSKSLSVLENINSIINKTFNKNKLVGDTDGDGDVENSFLDKMRKKKEGNTTTNTKSKDPIKKEDEKSSFFTKLIGILGATGASLVTNFTGFIKLFSTSAIGVVSKLAGVIAPVIPALWAVAKKGAGSVLDSLGGGKLGKLAKGAALMGAAGFATDFAAGKLGVGKDAQGNDIKIDEDQDDKNWNNMSILQKTESGISRGIEKISSFLFLDNFANQAKSERIKTETDYLNKNLNKLDTSASILDRIKKSLSSISFDILNNYDKEKNIINSLRFTQYGFQSNYKEYNVKLLTLEKYLFPLVTSDNEINEENLNIKEILSLFGLNPTRQDHLVLFLDWYQKRFKPVFFKHLEAAKKIIGKSDFSEIYKLDKVQLKQYLDLVMFSEGPYDYNRLPILDSRLIPTTADDVYNEYSKINKILLQATPLPKPIIYNNKEDLSPQTPIENMDRFDRLNKKILDQSKNKLDFNSLVDGEHEPKSTTVSPLPDAKAGKLVVAPGDLYTGRNAQSFLSVGQGVNLGNLNPQLLKQFYGMVEEYGTLTGKKLSVTSAHRDREQQEKLYAKYGPGGKAAKPGNSLHEFGLALDADPKGLDEMEKLGLMRKYGFTRPVGAEDWHVEPIGIQLDLNRFKRDPAAANEAISAGIGRGGGGFGIMPDAPKYSRNLELSKSIMMADAQILDNKNNSINRFASNGVDLPADPTVKIPSPTGNGYLGVKDTIVASAKTVGVDPQDMMKIAAVESSFNINAKSNSSSASGLFQFTKATWKDMLTKHGSQYGLDMNTDVLDPKANSLMAAHYIKENKAKVSSINGGDVSTTDVYLSHLLGPTGANKFITAMKENPNQYGSTVVPNAARTNPQLFYMGDTIKPRTLKEIYTNLDDKLNNKIKQFGLDPVLDNPNIQMVVYKTNKDISAPNTRSILDSANKPTISEIINETKLTPLTPVSKRDGFKPIEQSQINQELMKNTEELLGQSVEVQTKMLKTLGDILNVVSNKPIKKQESTNEIKPPNNPKPYTSPDPGVSMRRNMV